VRVGEEDANLFFEIICEVFHAKNELIDKGTLYDEFYVIDELNCLRF